MVGVITLVQLSVGVRRGMSHSSISVCQTTQLSSQCVNMMNITHSDTVDVFTEFSVCHSVTYLDNAVTGYTYTLVIHGSWKMYLTNVFGTV